MNKKLKSLLYLGAFMIAAIVYNGQMEAPETNALSTNKELAEADITIRPFTQDIAQDRTQ
ncbi:hypothetical protein ACOCEA_17220 [Maribacter sp. CXY002]|uniref:hypothetical protein n=1 Tax=Maribacter luteocoastalis TaxID=3407671 RepID=UPI003B67DEFC